MPRYMRNFLLDLLKVLAELTLDGYGVNGGPACHFLRRNQMAFLKGRLKKND